MALGSRIFITVRGYFDPDEGIFEVEKILLSIRNEPYRLPLGSTDMYFELDRYKKSIARKGVLDIATEYFLAGPSLC